MCRHNMHVRLALRSAPTWWLSACCYAVLFYVLNSCPPNSIYFYFFYIAHKPFSIFSLLLPLNFKFKEDYKIVSLQAQIKQYFVIKILLGVHLKSTYPFSVEPLTLFILTKLPLSLCHSKQSENHFIKQKSEQKIIT